MGCQSHRGIPVRLGPLAQRQMVSGSSQTEEPMATAAGGRSCPLFSWLYLHVVAECSTSMKTAASLDMLWPASPPLTSTFFSNLFYSFSDAHNPFVVISCCTVDPLPPNMLLCLLTSKVSFSLCFSYLKSMSASRFNVTPPLTQPLERKRFSQIFVRSSAGVWKVGINANTSVSMMCLLAQKAMSCGK